MIQKEMPESVTITATYPTGRVVNCIIMPEGFFEDTVDRHTRIVVEGFVKSFEITKSTKP